MWDTGNRRHPRVQFPSTQWPDEPLKAKVLCSARLGPTDPARRLEDEVRAAYLEAELAARTAELELID